MQKPAKVPFKEVDVNTVADNSNTNEVQAIVKPAEKPVANGSDKPKESTSAATAKTTTGAASRVVDMADSKCQC